jgi:molybdopterin-guanine dinucleotide biosynthesis protein A
MNFSAVLLCGGDSRRMGHDKALVEWNGTPLHQLQIAKLRALRPEQIFVSARADKSWRPRDVALVLDELETRGPVSGIAAALRACEGDHLLVLAIDLPLITSEYLHAMLRRTSLGRGIVPTIDGRFEPVAAVYPRESLAAFGSDGGSLQAVIRELIRRGEMHAFEVEADERDLFRNINQPADLIAS